MRTWFNLGSGGGVTPRYTAKVTDVCIQPYCSVSSRHQASHVERLLNSSVQPTFELIPTTGRRVLFTSWFTGWGCRGPGLPGNGAAPTQQVDFVCVWRSPAKRKLAHMLVRARYPFVNRESIAVQLTSKGTWHLHEHRARKSGETCLSYVLATLG